MLMIIVLHASIALASLVYATYGLVTPRRTHFGISYSLVAATLVSGTALIVDSHTSLVQACTSGLMYLGVVGTLILTARYRLARQTISRRRRG